MSRFVSLTERDRSADDDRCYLFVQRGLYVRPNRSFTNLKSLAGRFSLLDAISARSAIVVHESHATANSGDLLNAAHGLPPRDYAPPPPPGWTLARAWRATIATIRRPRPPP